MALVPPIGASGIFQLSSPFAAALIAGVSYTCVAVRRLSEIVHLGFDPFETYYQPYGITRQVYNSQMQEEACIVALRSSGGIWLYVPSAYITAYPDAGGIQYTSLVLGVDIGPIPNHLNLSAIKTKIISDIRDYIGVNATVMTVAVSETSLVSQANHNAIEAARTLLIAGSDTDRSKYLQVLAQKNALQAKVTELEAYFIAHPPP